MGKSDVGKRRRPYRKTKPNPSHFKPGQNSQSGEVMRRGPDILPRKQVVASVQMAALARAQLRDPRTGRLSRSKWARPVQAAGLNDFLRAHTRLLYVLAHGDPKEAAILASAVTRTGEYFGSYIDDKPTGPTRVTKFVFPDAKPSREVPPTSDRPPTPAEGRYEEFREEDVPRP